MIVKIPVYEHTLVTDTVTFCFVSITGIFVSHREANIDADGWSTVPPGSVPQ